MDSRSATVYSGGHSDDVDYVSWNPTHPELFCTSSTRDRRIVFWDARRMFNWPSRLPSISHFWVCLESRYTQQVSVKFPPAQTIYTPDGRSLGYISALNQLFFLNYGKINDESSKEEWHTSNIDSVRSEFNLIHISNKCINFNRKQPALSSSVLLVKLLYLLIMEIIPCVSWITLHLTS